MKKLLLLLACLSVFAVDAKTSGDSKGVKVIKAITDEGRVVFLKNDGTWRYEDGEASNQKTEIKVNTKPMTKTAAANFLLKSTKNNSAFWVNTSLWSFQKTPESAGQHEYKFLLKGEDLYAMVITEKVEIDLENLGGIALSNAKNLAPDTEILDQEYRTVNGLKVLYQKMAGTAKGMKFVFEGYYYSDKSGTTQLVVWSGENLMPKYQTNIADFLNGLTIQEQ